jgi:hypothetical protein
MLVPSKVVCPLATKLTPMPVAVKDLPDDMVKVPSTVIVPAVRFRDACRSRLRIWVGQGKIKVCKQGPVQARRETRKRRTRQAPFSRLDHPGGLQ